MNWLEALILGIVQGLTEFLPVSSSGHIEIGQELLGTASEDNLAFAVIVHTATVVSTMVVLWNEVSKIFRGTFTSLQWNAEKDYAAKIFVSMIPVFIVGVFFKEQVENLFGNGLRLVGVCLMITALLLALSEWLQSKRQGNGHEITYRDAIVIGIAQACAVLPGLSRSGSTIATGLLCGVKKENVAQFSFLMVLIPILGEALLDLLKLLQGEITLGVGLVPGVVGFISAFITGCFACRFMIEIVRRQRLVWFALYCAVVGIGTIIYSIY